MKRRQLLWDQRLLAECFGQSIDVMLFIRMSTVFVVNLGIWIGVPLLMLKSSQKLSLL